MIKIDSSDSKNDYSDDCSRVSPFSAFARLIKTDYSDLKDDYNDDRLGVHALACLARWRVRAFKETISIVAFIMRCLTFKLSTFRLLNYFHAVRRTNVVLLYL